MASRAGAVREGNGTRTIINNDAKIFDWETSWKNNEAWFELNLAWSRGIVN
jgi:hypothetical protein